MTPWPRRSSTRSFLRSSCLLRREQRAERGRASSELCRSDPLSEGVSVERRAEVEVVGHDIEPSRTLSGLKPGQHSSACGRARRGKAQCRDSVPRAGPFSLRQFLHRGARRLVRLRSRCVGSSSQQKVRISFRPRCRPIAERGGAGKPEARRSQRL